MHAFGFSCAFQINKCLFALLRFLQSYFLISLHQSQHIVKPFVFESKINAFCFLMNNINQTAYTASNFFIDCFHFL